MRSSNWAKTGIVALRDAELTALPAEVWDVSSQAHILDLTNNHLTALPDEFALLRRLQKLSLSRNKLTSLNDSLVPAFQGLQVLSLSHNRHDFLPCASIEESMI